MRTRNISAAVCAMSLLGAFAVAPLVLRGDFARTVVGDIVPMVILTGTVLICIRNTFDSHSFTRLFWSLMTVGMAMWSLNLVAWVWFEVVQHRPIPDPFFGDVVLFLHFVPIMAAVSIHRGRGNDETLLFSILNVGMLLAWWTVLYAFVVLPQQYIVRNRAVYALRWDVLYLFEGLIMIGLSGRAFATSTGAWRNLYRSIFSASVIYSLTSVFINAAIRQHTYRSGGLWDIPYLASILCFFWTVVVGRRFIPELQDTISHSHELSSHHRQQFAAFLARLALLSLPCMGYWALFMNNGPMRIREMQFAVAVAGAAVLIFFLFFKQHLLDRRLMQLLDESRRSYEELQQLQGRVIQQEKLASLGELVSLGASELQYPLAAVLEASDALLLSNHLKPDQLHIAKKIGQQARRTRDLVEGMLSFAQQRPGEKIQLELKPLAQRAMQMQTFRLENREIQLQLKSSDPLPLINGNGNQLLHAFLEIIENAIDSLQESGKGQLVISLHADNRDVVIEFADTGSGLKSPSRVFDPFYTTKPIGKGTGLGLSATYGVIQDHKGQITCHNRPEGGAVFEIRLPALNLAADSSLPAVASAQHA